MTRTHVYVPGAEVTFIVEHVPEETCPYTGLTEPAHERIVAFIQGPPLAGVHKSKTPRRTRRH